MRFSVALQPPVYHAVNTAGQWADSAGTAAALMIIGVAAFRLHRRYHSWVPVILPLGALAAGFMEPLYTISTNLWYYKAHQVSILSTYGMNLPLWVVFSYSAAYGGLGLTVWWMLQRGTTPRSLWVTTAGLWIGFIVLEIGNLAIGTYTYYGDQPFRIASFPVWVSLPNGAICLSLGVLMALAGRFLVGKRQWLLLAACPATVGAGLFGTTFPEDVALHVAHPSRPLAYGAALATTLLALGMVALAIAIAPGKDAAASEATKAMTVEGKHVDASDPGEGRRAVLA